MAHGCELHAVYHSLINTKLKDILKSEMYYQIIYIEVFIFFPVALQRIMYKVEIICRIPKIRKQLYEYGSNILI